MLTTTSTPQQVEIATLCEHPDNYNMFARASQQEIDELASDIERRGLQHPIEILPDGTIVCGHRRVLAATDLGWETIPAIVRDDLGEADDPRVKEALIRDNVLRRQLDEISMARCYRELKHLAEEQGIEETGDSRDALAARLGFGVSGRTLDRLERLLDLPGEIQDMITARQLTQSQGTAILRLDEDERETVYEALREAEVPRAVLEDLGVIGPKKATPPHRTAEKFLQMFQRDIEQYADDLEQLDGTRVRSGTMEALDNLELFARAWRRRMKKVLGR